MIQWSLLTHWRLAHLYLLLLSGWIVMPVYGTTPCLVYWNFLALRTQFDSGRSVISIGDSTLVTLVLALVDDYCLAEERISDESILTGGCLG